MGGALCRHVVFKWLLPRAPYPKRQFTGVGVLVGLVGTGVPERMPGVVRAPSPYGGRRAWMGCQHRCTATLPP
jgi:hypothetical protein